VLHGEGGRCAESNIWDERDNMKMNKVWHATPISLLVAAVAAVLVVRLILIFTRPHVTRSPILGVVAICSGVVFAALGFGAFVSPRIRECLCKSDENRTEGTRHLILVTIVGLLFIALGSCLFFRGPLIRR